MKAKNDFITNSSSCSFVFLGLEVVKKVNYKILLTTLYEDQIDEIEAQYKELSEPKLFLDEDDYKKIFKFITRYGDIKVSHNNDITILSDIEDGAPEGKTLVGFGLMDIDDCGNPEKVSGYDLSKKILILENLREKLGLDEPASIYGTTRMC